MEIPDKEIDLENARKARDGGKLRGSRFEMVQAQPEEARRRDPRSEDARTHGPGPH